MTELQKIQLRQSQLKTQISEELAKEERDTETLERLTNEAAAVEVEYRAALVVEEERDLPADEVEKNDDGEGKEMRELRNRVDFQGYLDAALDNRHVTGEHLELNQALGVKGEIGHFPLDALSGNDVELRTARDTDSQTNQSSWIDRVFAMTAAMRVGITMRSVQPGIASVPVVTAGGTPVQRGRTEAVTESAYTFAVTEAKPKRKAVHAIYSNEDMLRFPGSIDAISRDMRMAMTERCDRTIFLGDVGATGTDADIAGLVGVAMTEQEITQTEKATGKGSLDAFLAMVDGVYANSLSDLSVVLAIGAYRYWEAQIHNNVADNETVASFMRRAGLSWGTRGEIEDDTMNEDFAGFVGRKNGISGAGIAFVWNQAQLIRDEYTNATSGEVKLTLSYYWDLQFPRLANFQRVKFVT